MVTIYDIAKKAGVSSTTVSKVLNDHHDVSEKTRQKVKDIIKESGYQPTANARGLATKKTKMIGVFFQYYLYPGLWHPFFQDVLVSFKEVVGSEGYDLIIFSNTKPYNELKDFVARARHRGVDGILLYGVPRTDPDLAALVQSRIPCMSIDLDLLGPATGYLTSDNVDGAMKAVNYLVEMGHRDIAYISDISVSKPGHDRLIGYQTALRNHNISIRSEWVVNADFSEDSGYRATKKLLDIDKIPSAIFFSSDIMAIGGMQAIREKGLVIGNDISIIGFDDISLLKYISPGLTTIRQKKEEMGRRTANELLKLIDHPNEFPSILTVETELVIRETVCQKRFMSS